VFARVALCGGTVTNCTQADLQAALVGGGTVLFACSGTITLTSTIVIVQDTTIDANGYVVTISGGSAVRLFQLNSAVSFWAKGLTLANGSSVGTNGASGDPPAPGGDGLGAGLLNLGGALTLTDCTLTNHYVRGGTAGMSPNWETNNRRGGDGRGAAIASLGGSLNLTNCLIVGNTAKGGQGSPINNTFSDIYGDAGDAKGGAIYSAGAGLNLQTTTVWSNLALGGDPQLGYNSTGRGGDGEGGGIYATNSVLYLASSVLASNVTQGGAPLAFRASGKGSGSGLGGGLFLSQDSSTVTRLTSFSGNAANGGGASRQKSSGLGCGGAVFVGGDLRISDSTFSGNNATGGAYGIAGAGQGGAIYNSNTLAITGCTFDHNLALGGSGEESALATPGGNGEGGAIWTTGQMALTNSTCAANQAQGGWAGCSQSGGESGASGAGRGGALCVSGGTVTMVSTTIATNRADAGTGICKMGPSQGGGLNNTNGVVTVRNSIIANSANGGEVWGTVTDGGYNICSDNTANFDATGSLNNADPLLSALSANGGPTATMSLLVGSPARDAIPSDFPAVDQRGVSRPQGPAADIGAFEADYVGSAPTIVNQPQGGTVRAGTNLTLTVVATGNGTLYYQWRKNANPIGGATTTALALANVQAADAGTYSVLVTNSGGSTLSQGAVLVVDSRPLILVQPHSVVISPGANTNFIISADGPSLTYQWWHESTVLPGATGSSLIINNASPGAQGSYFAVITNFAGAATSAVATLEFDSSALNILRQPSDQTVENGYPATFDVLVSGVPPLAYQWQHNGASIAGATNSNLSFSSVHSNDNGSYRVVVTNGYKTVTSSNAQLVVTPGATPPLLTVQRLGTNLAITFGAQAGRTYRLLSSSDLSAWSPVATNSASTTGPLQFVRPTTVALRSFYRVVTP
jgi:hypothetical protein